MPVSQATRFGKPHARHLRHFCGVDAFSCCYKPVFNTPTEALKTPQKGFPQPKTFNTARAFKNTSTRQFLTPINAGKKVVSHIFHKFPQAFLTFLWKTPQFSTTSSSRSATLWKTQIFPHNFQKVFHNTES